MLATPSSRSRTPSTTILPRRLMAAGLLIGLLQLAGCDHSTSSNDQPASGPVASAPAVNDAASAPASGASAATSMAYQPLSADQLEQMVAPIALFPDKLLAQVLTGSAFPDQIQAAQVWIAQQNIKDATALQNAADQQPWDVSVKALTAFPSVLQQMSQNLTWTTALGQAYANDPTDVMNAVQVMRQRASSSGHLASSSQLKVTTCEASSTQPVARVIPAPTHLIEIEPAQPNVVYVPSYNPTVVYGEPVDVYPGYRYEPAYADPVVVGALAFGAGVFITEAFDRHPWGWNSWNLDWNDREHHYGNWNGNGNGGGYNGGGPRGPAVVYNHNVYAPRIQNNRMVNNYNGGERPGTPNFNGAGERPGMPGGEQHGMTMPQFHPSDLRPSVGEPNGQRGNEASSRGEGAAQREGLENRAETAQGEQRATNASGRAAEGSRGAEQAREEHAQPAEGARGGEANREERAQEGARGNEGAREERAQPTENRSIEANRAQPEARTQAPMVQRQETRAQPQERMEAPRATAPREGGGGGHEGGGGREGGGHEGGGGGHEGGGGGGHEEHR